ncbi:GGDEF domain-containing protein [Leptothrix sp. BB-4]
MLTLDVPTLYIALLTAMLLFGVALGQAGEVPEGHGGLRHWAWSSWTAAAGFVMLAARVVLPEWVSALAGNLLIGLSLLLVGQALHRFLRQDDVPRWQIGLLVLHVALVGLALATGLPVPWRSAQVSLMYAIQLLPSVWLIACHLRTAERAIRMVGVTLGLTVTALLLRTVDALLSPQAYSSLFQASLGNGLTYMAAFLFPLGAGFGFLLANLERSTRRLRDLATHDSLTGCANRNLFDAQLRTTLEQARRDATPVSLLVLDLDHFKAINDRHGHQAGDAVLKACAQALQGRLRGADLLARLGGEEFAVVLARTPADDALRVAEDLRLAVAALTPVLPGLTDGTPDGHGTGQDGRSVHVSIRVSIGVATVAGEQAPTPDALYGLADRALYQAKAQGRDRSVHARDLPERAG